MYDLLQTETLTKTAPKEKRGMTFVRKDIEYILNEMGVDFPTTILYTISGEEYKTADLKEAAELLSDSLVLVVVGVPECFLGREIDYFLDTAMKEFCENDFIPVNNMIGQYEKRETFIYGNPIGKLVASFIFEKERQYFLL